MADATDANAGAGDRPGGVAGIQSHRSFLSEDVVHWIMAQWLIYGANGYTGQLMAAEAVRRGLKPILAGRNADAL
ncbi:MAG: hypothetical protein ABI661_06875, partial [Gammaproteobacteria bacterium]